MVVRSALFLFKSMDERTFWFLMFQLTEKVEWTIAKRQRAMENIMFAIFLQDHYSISSKTDKNSYNFWYTSRCLPSKNECYDKGTPLEINTRILIVRYLKQKHIKVIRLPTYSPRLAMYFVWLIFFFFIHSKIWMDNLKEAFNLWKLAWKSVLMLYGATLNTPKIW